VWGVFNLFFLIASIRLYVFQHSTQLSLVLVNFLPTDSPFFQFRNVVYIIIFLSLELCLIFDAASQFKRADGMIELSENLSTVGGAFAFVASIFGYYTVLHYLCQESLPFTVVMGDTSRFFERRARGPSTSVKESDDLV
jgi:hypothetical protein